MENAKGKIVNFLIFVYLVLFPFGQLARWELSFGNQLIPVHPVDIIAGLFLVLLLVLKFPKPALFWHIKNFLYVGLFSLVLSLAIFKTPTVVVGGLYLLRLASYAAFFVVFWNVAKKEGSKEKLFKFLLGIAFAVAAFGWFQYFFYPDIRPLLEWGWDEHLFRMVGPFLDPTFTSIILVFGFMLALAKKSWGLVLFFLLSVAFTYARAGYLGLLAGSLAILVLRQKIKSILFITLALLTIVVILPRPAGEGVKLSRTNSIFARVENYRESLQIFAKAPLFGVGYNNFCLARKVYLGDTNLSSHACSGSDASALLILTTTGVLGALAFLKLVWEIGRSLSGDVYGLAFIGSSVALAVHGIFANSYFYPWVMGFLAILLATALRERTSR